MTRVAVISRAAALLASLAFLLAAPLNAFAWGYEGHWIIAEIAKQFLEPQPAHQVRELLAIENVTTLADVSTCADEIRLQQPETAPGHNVNTPVSLPKREPAVYDG